MRVTKYVSPRLEHLFTPKNGSKFAPLGIIESALISLERVFALKDGSNSAQLGDHEKSLAISVNVWDSLTKA